MWCIPVLGVVTTIRVYLCTSMHMTCSKTMEKFLHVMVVYINRQQLGKVISNSFSPLCMQFLCGALQLSKPLLYNISNLFSYDHLLERNQHYNCTNYLEQHGWNEIIIFGQIFLLKMVLCVC